MWWASIARFARRYPNQLSGGQQQRVGVARGLAVDPNILLMDEPFGAVDPIVRSDLQQEVLRLQRELAKTIVFVTHDIDEAFLLGDQVVILETGGRIVQTGSPEEILAAPANDFVASFVGADRGKRALTRKKAGNEHACSIDGDGHAAGVLVGTGRELAASTTYESDLAADCSTTCGSSVIPIVVGFVHLDPARLARVAVPPDARASCSRSPGCCTRSRRWRSSRSCRRCSGSRTSARSQRHRRSDASTRSRSWRARRRTRSASVDPDVRQSATARRLLARGSGSGGRLPAGRPVLLAGLRVVAVSTIALRHRRRAGRRQEPRLLFTNGHQRHIVPRSLTGIVLTMAGRTRVRPAARARSAASLMPWTRDACRRARARVPPQPMAGGPHESSRRIAGSGSREHFATGRDCWRPRSASTCSTRSSRCLIAAAIAIPIGYSIGHTGRGREIAVGIAGAARALPSFGLILLLISLVGVVQRPVAAFAAFVILAIPPILAGAYSGIEAIDRATIDAARAVGMTEWQILWKVEVPLGLQLLHRRAA